MAADSEFTPITRRLGCLRGISTLTGFALAVEIGDWTRFSGASIGAFVGLTPSEHSSGSSRSQGRSPRPATAMPVGCWSRPPGTTGRRIGPGRRCRTGGRLAPVAAQVRGDAGNRRLHRQWVRFTARKKSGTIAAVAVARELAGWCWSLATLDTRPAKEPP